MVWKSQWGLDRACIRRDAGCIQTDCIRYILSCITDSCARDSFLFFLFIFDFFFICSLEQTSRTARERRKKKISNSNRGDSDDTITAGVKEEVGPGCLSGPVSCLPFLAFFDGLLFDKADASRRRRAEQPLLELRLLPPPAPSLSCPSIPLLLFQPLPLLAKLGFDKARRRGWTTRCFGIFLDDFFFLAFLFLFSLQMNSHWHHIKPKGFPF